MSFIRNKMEFKARMVKILSTMKFYEYLIHMIELIKDRS